MGALCVSALDPTIETSINIFFPYESIEDFDKYVCPFRSVKENLKLLTTSHAEKLFSLLGRLGETNIHWIHSSIAHRY